jgi:hypothetical protein
MEQKSAMMEMPRVETDVAVIEEQLNQITSALEDLLLQLTHELNARVDTWRRGRLLPTPELKCEEIASGLGLNFVTMEILLTETAVVVTADL